MNDQDNEVDEVRDSLTDRQLHTDRAVIGLHEPPVRTCAHSEHCIQFLFSSRRRHTRLVSDWSSDVCSSDLGRLRPGAQDDVVRSRAGIVLSAWAKAALYCRTAAPSA